MFGRIGIRAFQWVRVSVSGDKVISVRHTPGKLSLRSRAAVELCGAVEAVWTGMLKGFVSRSGDKVDENANAANDSLPARRHLSPSSPHPPFCSLARQPRQR